MNHIVTKDGAAERGPVSPESKDRIIFQLSDKWALGYDRLQWMVMRARKRRGQREWRPISFVDTEKTILFRCIREKGVQPTPEAQAKLDALPDTFKEWLAMQDQANAA